MATLYQLLKHVKEKGNHPFLLEVIRAVIRERMGMPHAAVWCVMETIRLDERIGDVNAAGIPKFVEEAKRWGPRKHRLFCGDSESDEGYLVGYYYRDAYGEYDYEEFVIDATHAEYLADEYIRRAEFD